MSSQETQYLTQLLTTFRVADLGEGDINAGTNLLAIMAVTLANLAPADDSIILHSGTPARLGTSLLITGSVSSGRAGEEVITEVGRRQANLATRLRRYCDWVVEQASKPSLVTPPTGPGTDSADDLLGQVLGEFAPLYDTSSQAWSRILNEAPVEQVRDLADRPKFLVCAARAKDLEAQLKGLRPGHPLIHVGISRPADFAELVDLGAALLEGRYPIGDGCELLRGNMILSDPLRLLNEAAKAPDERTAWLGHFLWLADGDAGPQVPEEVFQAMPVSGSPSTERFRLALGNVMASRLSLHEMKTQRLYFDTRAATYRWTDFLDEMEPHLPGISGAARNLLNSLVFGLYEMARFDERLVFSMAGVEAFARLLVRRAINARTAICHAADVALRRSQIEKVFRKLQNGWFEERKIYKDLAIPAADCRDSLLWLQEAGLALRMDRKWGLLEGACLNFTDCRLPLLEV